MKGGHVVVVGGRGPRIAARFQHDDREALFGQPRGHGPAAGAGTHDDVVRIGACGLLDGVGIRGPDNEQ